MKKAKPKKQKRISKTVNKITEVKIHYIKDESVFSAQRSREVTDLILEMILFEK